ncbi:Cysteine-rich receptor-like protein kinase [Actinidia chinensis var. chinensis]|uniref:Cysteine-rich receptor-like protein kinase n=1 Tax=Actinidia chinensis var. chinensis TaxID=1590841 RepID=A0A2R6P9Z0_ACTCC|nr:Cysteine-rich receptor-like protein kinase [Actinidia chinensis var. chinensis]
MSWQAILSYLLLLHFLHTVLACDSYCRYTCDYTTNYTSSSIFSSNLDQALHTIKNNTGLTGYNATIAGNLTQPVTAMGICRGGLGSSECQTCIASAVEGVRLTCPNQAGGQIWYDYCMVRYSSVDFLGEVNASVLFRMTDPTVAPDLESYVPIFEFLMENLSSIGAASDERYAIGRTKLLGNNTLYGYFECTRDLSSEECAKCFSSATVDMKLWCVTLQVCWVLTPNCNAQVTMSPASHVDWIFAPLLTNPVLAPSPNSPGGSGSNGGNGNSSGSGRGNGENDLKIMISIGAVVAFLLIVGLLLASRMAMKRGKVDRENVVDMMRREGIDTRPNLFDLDELVAATDNFSTSNLLGSGGFGIVYKGKMPDGENIAVKKLSPDSIQGLGVFFNEVRVLLNMQHRNLVRMLGYCVQGAERILVYEYLPNKSLDNFLFDKSKSALLDWPKRYNIILGIARGILYLHEDSSLKIIHRDIKASNILLDEQMNPKISDFGLAKLFSDEKTHCRTRQIAGTYGYMAPEYANRGVLSMKSDMFSFGVLILEIISGRKNYDLQFDEEQRQLLNFAWNLELEGRLIELVDETMGSLPVDEVARCMRIGLLCCQECIQDRPTVSSVLSMLSSNSASTIPPAGRPGYHQESINYEAVPEESEVDAHRNNHEVNSISHSFLVRGR